MEKQIDLFFFLLYFEIFSIYSKYVMTLKSIYRIYINKKRSIKLKQKIFNCVSDLV